jgi:hypothetical protein
MPSLEVYNEQDLSGTRFIYEILTNIENLENNGRIIVTRRGKFILRIDLTDHGKELLKDTLFASKVV